MPRGDDHRNPFVIVDASRPVGGLRGRPRRDSGGPAAREGRPSGRSEGPSYGRSYALSQLRRT